jgi:very-short-patch-repair endonuclease
MNSYYYEKVKAFNPEYEFKALIKKGRMTLKYIPTGEIFDCSTYHFFKGKAHAPSLANKFRQEKRVETTLAKYGVDHISKVKEVKSKEHQTKLEKGLIRELMNGKTIKEVSGEKNISYTHLCQLYNKGVDILSLEKSDGTNIEQVIKSILEDLRVEFEREKYFNNNKIRVDFYISKFELVIEANGLYWHSDNKVKKDYHYDRRKTLINLGLNVIQFTEDLILEDPIRVKYMIKDFIESGGKESYTYKDEYLIINLDYSIPPAEGYNLVEEWIEKRNIQGNAIYNSGMQKWKSLLNLST